MKLLQISAKRYKTLEDISIDFSGNYCVLSGRNNSGKSAILGLLQKLFHKSDIPMGWDDGDAGYSYPEDKTQWLKDDAPIEVSYSLSLSRADDPALISFIERISKSTIAGAAVTLSITNSVAKNDVVTTAVWIDGKKLDDQGSKDVVTRLTSSNLLFLHNSTLMHEDMYMHRGRLRSFSHVLLSDEDQRELASARKFLTRKMKTLARRHRTALTDMLARLSDKYEVEFSSMESHSRMVPFVVNLKDKKVQGPLTEWGSGTQNRTHILMSILQAIRIKTHGDPKDKITPIVVIEEPESFLHPSAQAEFGRLLRTLSAESGIQLIVTTHNPYMLNQEQGDSNILLDRQKQRGKLAGTYRVPATGDKWMNPFADHMGLVPDEFQNWLPVFTARQSRVLLVEGDIDKEYFDFIRDQNLTAEQLDPDVEVVAYGGRGALVNSLLLKFVIGKFNAVYVTFDRDAKKHVEKVLGQLGLKENADYCSIGLPDAGKDCIEGLVPGRICNSVMASSGDLALRLGSGEKEVREDARAEFKKKMLAAFKSSAPYTKEEMAHFSKVVSLVNRKIKASK